MTESELKDRTKAFALAILTFVEGLPRDRVTDHIGRQLIRCGTSVGANYRAACRGRSDAEMAAKLGIVEEEADEVLFWLEILTESGKVKDEEVAHLQSEGDAILRITVRSIKTLRGRSGVREELAPYLTEVDSDVFQNQSVSN